MGTHKEQALLSLQQGDDINFIYHRLMMCEVEGAEDNSSPFNLNCDEHYMIVQTLSEHPEYSYFWRHLGNIHSHSPIDCHNFIKGIPYLKESILLGNIEAAKDWIITFDRWHNNPHIRGVFEQHSDIAPKIITNLQNIPMMREKARELYKITT